VPTVSFRVLSTLVSWVITLLLVAIGGRWLAALPPPGAPLPVATADRPRTPTVEPAEEDVALATEPADAGEPAAEPLPRRLVVAATVGVNLRAAPTTASPIVAVLPPGAFVDEQAAGGEASAATAGWRRVRWEGRAGWVAEELVQPAGATP